MQYLCKLANNNEYAQNDTISEKAVIDDINNWIHICQTSLKTYNATMQWSARFCSDKL